MLSIGQRIRELRRSKDISQEELGLEIGVSRQTVNKWETDVTTPNIDNIKALCGYFNVKADYFIPVGTDIKGEIALSSEKQKSGTKKTIPIIALVLLSLALIIALVFTVATGFIVFSDSYNAGIDYVSTSGIDRSEFYACLAVSIVLLGGIIFSSVLLIKKK